MLVMNDEPRKNVVFSINVYFSLTVSAFGICSGNSIEDCETDLGYLLSDNFSYSGLSHQRHDRITSEGSFPRDRGLTSY